MKKQTKEEFKDFVEIQKRDNIKIAYCGKKNIPLIHIPYWHKNDISKHIKYILRSK